MTDKKLIIIGGGVAGLSTGYYARINGYDVDIYEMHDKPGGMCTSWKRKNYIFDYCMHNVAGTSPKSGLYQIWKELGALDNCDVIDHDEFVCVESPDSVPVHWYTDLARLEKHLKEIAPDDSAAIDDLIGSAKKFSNADVMSIGLGGMMRMLRVLPHLSLIKRLTQTPIAQFARNLKSPALRRAMMHIMYDMSGDDVPMAAIVMFMAGMSAGDLGWPAGGSLAFSRRIEKSYMDAGGRIRYKAKVEKILVEDNCATGVLLSDGTELRADRIISAADGYDTIYRMLEGRYLTGPIEKYYGRVSDTGPFGLVIFLGVNGEYPDVPHALTLIFDGQIDLGGIKQDSLHVVTFGPETGLVPEGKFIVKIEAQAVYPYWKERRNADIAAYRDEKKRIADMVIKRIAPRFPGLEDRIEVIDVSTPPTAERYTGNRYGWQPGPPVEDAAEIQRKGLSKTLPGLDGFFHVGQWASATIGISGAATSGRSLIKDLCKKDGKRFTVEA